MKTVEVYDALEVAYLKKPFYVLALKAAGGSAGPSWFAWEEYLGGFIMVTLTMKWGGAPQLKL